MTTQEHPNWKSSKIKERLIKIRDMALYEFAYTNEREINNKEKLAPAFGQQQNKWSKYFYDLLLTDVSPKYKSGLCSKERRFSWTNLLWAFEQAGLTSTTEVISKLGEEIDIQKVVNEDVSLCLLQRREKRAKDYFDLMDLKQNHTNLHHENAQYHEDETTTRLIANHQNKSKLVRGIFWANWFDYDIKAASFSIIHQEALVKGLIKEGQLPTIELAYRDSNNFRSQIAQELDCSTKIVKMILAAMAFNIKLNKNPYSQLHKKIKKQGVNPSRIYAKADKCELLQKLTDELAILWPLLMTDWEKSTGKSGRDIFRKESINKETGEIKFRYSSSKFRACIYFRLERKVLDSIRSFMSGKVCHLMHDGFFTPEQVDLEKLRMKIKQDTSYQLELTEDILSGPESC